METLEMEKPTKVSEGGFTVLKASTLPLQTHQVNGIPVRTRTFLFSQKEWDKLTVKLL